MKRILIVDDHLAIRQGIARGLQAGLPQVVCDEAGDGREAMTKIWNGAYDLMLMDLILPGRSGLEMIPQIKKVRPGLPILVLSMYPETLFGYRVLRAGAAGYVEKTRSLDTLVDAVRHVLEGRKYITPTLAEQLVRSFDASADEPLHQSLNDQEFQILRLLAQGRKTREIALELSVSPKTVASHRIRIRKKLGLRNTSQVIRFSVLNGLAP